MKPMPFQYHRAASLDDALTVLGQAAGGGRLLSGGQSLVPMLNLRLLPADVLIDLKRLTALHAVDTTGDSIRYGACITHARFEDGDVPDACGGLLRHVGGGIAYRAVRNRGTLGGALALADASTDWVTAMMTAGASVELYGVRGTRRMSVSEFVQGPYQTRIDPDTEILVAVTVPQVSRTSRWGYYKIMQKPGEYASSLAGVLIDREHGHSRATLGGANRAPLALERTATTLATAPAWSAALETALSEAVRADLSSAGRGGEPWEQASWTTCVLRAARHALTSTQSPNGHPCP